MIRLQMKKNDKLLWIKNIKAQKTILHRKSELGLELLFPQTLQKNKEKESLGEAGRGGWSKEILKTV